MRSIKVLSGALGCMIIMASAVSAQVVVLRPGFGPVGPRGFGPPVVAARYAVPVSPVYRASYIAPPVYRSSYIAPRTYTAAPTYAYRPAIPVPSFPVVPAYTTYRPAVVGPGIGGFPNVYVPGQPIRNAIRYAVP
ncbi:MAG: hypothetical protein R3C53_05345 [Pirellulaceae bacterium]